MIIAETERLNYFKNNIKRSQKKIIRMVGLLKREQLSDADIGFSFLPEFEGNGYDYQTSVAVIKLAKETFKLKKLVTITNPDNNKSIKLIEN